MSSNAGPRFRIDTLLSGPGWRWSLCSLRARLRDATLLMGGFIQGATSFVTKGLRPKLCNGSVFRNSVRDIDFDLTRWRGIRRQVYTMVSEPARRLYGAFGVPRRLTY